MSTFPCLKLEGGLLAADLIDQIASGDAKGQKPSDFGLKPTTHLTDEISALWASAQDHWRGFQRRLERLDPNDPATSVTRDQWMIPFFGLFGYDQLTFQPKAAEADGQSYAISHRAGADDAAPPVHIVGCRQSLDRRPESGRPRLAPHSLVQDYLNRTEHVWGIAANGDTLRLLRDSQLISRQAFIEFDLRQMLGGQNFADFALLYRLLHRSRLPKGTDDAPKCLLEEYRRVTVEQGGRVRDHLRDGVEEALKLLANGFLRHPRNQELRARVLSGQLPPDGFYQQLLRLIYRLLFLMVAEERGLITENPTYHDHYSLGRLRRLLDVRTAWSAHDDLWLALLTTFRLFEDEKFGKPLAIPPLNGDLFNPLRTGDLNTLFLPNRDFLKALWQLAMYREKESHPWRRINYAALDVEELGSVYESLLDFQPIFSSSSSAFGVPPSGGLGYVVPPSGGLGSESSSTPNPDHRSPNTSSSATITFDLGKGTERKSTGSYYTPPQLVQELIKSALVPVMEDRLAKAKTPAEREQAILSIKVCDPASGSGHFLLAAARRLGRQLARVRAGDDEPSPDQFREAVRDVITHCIYAVDKNPLAVDLCRVALWLEGHQKGKPLTFLDHRIRQGDSLVGVLDTAVLSQGIPDDAFNPVTGDDKAVARDLKKQNKEERKRKLFGLPFQTPQELRSLTDDLRPILDLPDDSPENIRRKAEAYQRAHARGTAYERDTAACNLWTAAFFTPLTDDALKGHCIPTTHDLRSFLERGVADGRLLASAAALAHHHAFFHWPLEFPDVFAKGGFDVVLSNPPWERIKLQELEFFANRDGEVANAPKKSRRVELIERLQQRNPALWEEYHQALHSSESLSRFLRQSDRFPLTALGDINTYAVFSELGTRLLSPEGRLGMLVPTGIATDDTNKGFFARIIGDSMLVSLYDFENRDGLFPGVHQNYKFSLLTVLGSSAEKGEAMEFAFFLTQTEHLGDGRRVFRLGADELARLNPNTRTCPVFRTKADADLTRTIYERMPVLVEEATGANPWGIRFTTLFHMTNDSHFFRTRQEMESHDFSPSGNRFDKGEDAWLPLYEAKFIDLFEHRHASCESPEGIRGNQADLLSAEDLADDERVVTPRYWVDSSEVERRLGEAQWTRQWVFAFRDVTRAVDLRSSWFAVIPRVGVGNNAPLLLPLKACTRLAACLLADLNSLTFDFVARQKISGIHMNFFFVNQLPAIPPDSYAPEDLAFVAVRVVELTYTAWDIKGFADDVWREGDEGLRTAIRGQWEASRAATGGHEWHPPEWAEIAPDGIPLPPFKWDEARRALLRAELDALYARLYGLNRKQLRYILDPADLTPRELEDILDPYEEVSDPLDAEGYRLRRESSDFPGETFRVLRDKDIRRFGEYRTRRLVLEAWQRLNRLT